MAAPVAKSEDEILQRRSIVAELYQTGGYSFIDISRILKAKYGIKVSHVTYYNDMQACRDQWRTIIADSVRVMQQRELARLDWIEIEATKAWARSIGLTKIDTVTESNVTVDAAAMKEFPEPLVNKAGKKPRRQAGVPPGTGIQKIIKVALPGKKTITSSTSRIQNGDLTCLSVVLNCVAQRRAMLGLDAPQKIEFTDRRIESMTDEELMQEIDKAMSLKKQLPSFDITARDVTMSKHGPN